MKTRNRWVFEVLPMLSGQLPLGKRMDDSLNGTSQSEIDRLFPTSHLIGIYDGGKCAGVSSCEAEISATAIRLKGEGNCLVSLAC